MGMEGMEWSGSGDVSSIELVRACVRACRVLAHTCMCACVWLLCVGKCGFVDACKCVQRVWLFVLARPRCCAQSCVSCLHGDDCVCAHLRAMKAGRAEEGFFRFHRHPLAIPAGYSKVRNPTQPRSNPTSCHPTHAPRDLGPSHPHPLTLPPSPQPSADPIRISPRILGLGRVDH